MSHVIARYVQFCFVRLTVSECLDDGGEEGGDGRQCAVQPEVDDSSDVNLWPVISN